MYGQYTHARYFDRAYKRKYKFNKDGNLKQGRYKYRGKDYYKNWEKDKSPVLDSGYSVKQTYVGLGRAWLGYVIAHSEFDQGRMRYYAGCIQKLQRELVDANEADPSCLASFPNLRMWAHAEPGDYARHLQDEYTAFHTKEEESTQQQWLKNIYREQGVEIS